MVFLKKLYNFSLFQQLPYYDNLASHSMRLIPFLHSKDFEGNTLLLLYNNSSKVASAFSLSTNLDQKLIVHSPQAILSSSDLLSVAPASLKDPASVLLLSPTQLNMRSLNPDKAQNKTIYAAQQDERLLDIKISPESHLLIILTTKQIIQLDS